MSRDAALTSFVPRRVLRRLATTGAAARQPHCQAAEAALLFVDISGFVPFAERLSSLGPEGVEKLSGALNDFFGQLVDLTLRRGGDVASFHGDGFLVQWPASEAGSLDESVLSAARCALALQARVAATTAAPDGDEHGLAIKVALAAGECLAFETGGIDDRWTALLGGPTLEGLFAALDRARVGGVVVDRETRNRLGDRARIDPLDDPNAAGFGELLEVYGASQPIETTVPSLDVQSLHAVASFVPPVVRTRLAADQGDWLAELRRVSILFINLKGIDFTSEAALPLAQSALTAIQETLEALEGSLQQFVVDDKGAVVLAAFGLPPLAHEDDAARAALAGLEIRNRLRSVAGAPDFSIGVTRGRALCGPLGSQLRREYVMIGDVVNLSARLMGKAGPEGVLCSAEVAHEARQTVAFEELEPVRVKGRAQPVEAFEPRGPIDGASRHADDGSLPLMGRAEPQAKLRKHLDALTRGTGNVVVIEAEAGLGKSSLLEDFAAEARRRGIDPWRAGADAIEQRTPYLAFRTLLRTLLDSGAGSLDERRRALLQRFDGVPELQRLVPLLNVVLELELEDTELTAQMDGDVRADNTRDLLASVLQQEVDGPPLLLVEDLHWIDSASLALLRQLAEALPGMLVVATTRPSVADPAGELDGLLDRNVSRLQLASFDREATAELVRHRLESHELPGEIVEYVHSRSGGNPFYIEELVHALRETRALREDEGLWRLDERATDLVPGTLLGVVTSRIDRLAESTQLTTKVASVIGRSFELGLVEGVHPIGADEQALRADLSTLEHVDLTRLANEDSDFEWIFKHVVTQEAAYSLLPFAQRRELHERVAGFLERRHEDNPKPVLPLLAHHWHRAQDYDKAVEYLERSGEQALRNGSYRESIRSFEQAVEIAEEGQAEVEPVRRARWQRHLGDAHLRTGNPVRSRVHLERSLDDLNRSAPKNPASIAWQLARELGLQTLHRLAPGTFVGTARRRSATTEESYAAEYLGQVCFFTDVLGQGIAVTMRSLNLAERLGPSAQLARAYALTGTSAGIQGLHGLARYYTRLSRRVLESIDNLSDLSLVHVYFALEELSTCRWQEAERLSREGLEMAERIGDNRRWGDHQCLLAMGGRPSGDLRRARQALESARDSGLLDANPTLRCWIYCQLAEDALLRQEPGTALDLLEKAGERLAECGLSETIWHAGNLAVAHLERDDFDAALRAAEIGLTALRKIPPLRLAALEGYAGVAEVFLVAAGRAEDGPERRRLERNARIALRALEAFCRGFHLGRPRSALLRGRYALLRRGAATARTHFRKSLVEAERLAMPYEEALASRALADSLPADAAERSALEDRSERLLERLRAG
ncbi:MAG: adenylate/guanylate cyclase domain-containing protein [Acidobacteriota bacterium]